MNIWSLDPGRVLCRYGVPVATITRVRRNPSSTEVGFVLTPAEVDKLAQLVVNLLNLNDGEK